MTRTLALIGAGRWGKNLARNFDQLGVLHTVCDPKITWEGVQNTPYYHEVLQNDAIKEVAIASPAAMHYSLAKQAILAGKDVFVEKPLCLKSSEGKELVELAESKKKILMVGHLLHYHPCVRKLLELTSSGTIGQIRYIMSNRLSLGCIRTEENALLSFAPHDISLILALCGNQKPLSITCHGQSCITPGVVDMANVDMTFTDGTRAHIFASWLHPYKEQKLVIVGNRGIMIFDDREPWETKLKLFSKPVVWKDGNIPYANPEEGTAIEIPPEEPLKNECVHFLECCQKRTTPLTDGQEGLRVLEVLERAEKSLNGSHETASASYYAHPSAIIDEGSHIGAGTKIWHFCHVMKKSQIGKNCSLGQNVFVASGAILGSHVKVQNNVSIYSGVICEDEVFLGPNMVFTNVNHPRSSVDRRSSYETTLVRCGATIGANATIVCGTELGAYAFVGAGAVVTKDVPAYALVVGNPARQIGWMSRHGKRLDLPLYSEQPIETSCPETGETYTLHRNHLTVNTPCFV